MWVKHLLCKLEELNSGFLHPHKKLCWVGRDRRSLGLISQFSQNVELETMRDYVSKKRLERDRGDHMTGASDLHCIVSIHIHVHTHTEDIIPTLGGYNIIFQSHRSVKIL